MNESTLSHVGDIETLLTDLGIRFESVPRCPLDGCEVCEPAPTRLPLRSAA